MIYRSTDLIMTSYGRMEWNHIIQDGIFHNRGVPKLSNRMEYRSLRFYMAAAQQQIVPVLTNNTIGELSISLFYTTVLR